MRRGLNHKIACQCIEVRSSIFKFGFCMGRTRRVGGEVGWALESLQLGAPIDRVSCPRSYRVR